MTVVGFIPARGGSRRIPRKNLRQVGGVPLVARTVRTLLGGGCDLVVVSTDDEEIAAVAELWGASAVARPPELSGHAATIDAVVYDWLGSWPYGAPVALDLVVVAQPTSPMLSPVSVVNAIEYAREHGATVFTVAPERHLLWDSDNKPLYSARVNSDQEREPDYYRETGGLVVFDPLRANGAWPPGTPTMLVLDDVEAIDIDEYSDLTRARAGARPASIQIRYIEGVDVGSGHAHRARALAVELSGRHLVEVVRAHEAQISDESVPDLVILDKLDTTAEEIKALRAFGVKHIVTLEDLGRGAQDADVTINELYGKRVPSEGDYYWGPRWAVLRPEFLGHGPLPTRGEAPYTVVVSFGGTDPADLTGRIASVLAQDPLIGTVRVIVPPARPDFRMDLPTSRPETLIQVVSRPVMAREFRSADLVVTSAGRTVHEVAACGVPAIAVAANEREESHGVCPGVWYLPHATAPDKIARSVTWHLMHPALRAERAQNALRAVDGLGAQRIGWLVDGLLGGML